MQNFKLFKKNLKELDNSPPPPSPRQKFLNSCVFQGIDTFLVPKCMGISIGEGFKLIEWGLQ